MGGRWALALSVAVVAAAATVGAAAPDGGPADPAGDPAAAANEVCELGRADRARTPSRACMTCHDGAAGAAIPFSMKADGTGMIHPVAVDYGSAEGRFPGKYRPQGALPAHVPLVHGKVECTSCHDGASRAPKRVVDEPRLCNVCHQL